MPCPQTHPVLLSWLWKAFPWPQHPALGGNGFHLPLWPPLLCVLPVWCSLLTWLPGVGLALTKKVCCQGSAVDLRLTKEAPKWEFWPSKYCRFLQALHFCVESYTVSSVRFFFTARISQGQHGADLNRAATRAGGEACKSLGSNVQLRSGVSVNISAAVTFFCFRSLKINLKMAKVLRASSVPWKNYIYILN